MTFDDELTNKFVTDVKQFIKTYVLSIKDYDANKYGTPTELDLTGVKKQ
jgi:hypothetical protein